MRPFGPSALMNYNFSPVWTYLSLPRVEDHIEQFTISYLCIHDFRFLMSWVIIFRTDEFSYYFYITETDLRWILLVCHVVHPAPRHNNECFNGNVTCQTVQINYFLIRNINSTHFVVHNVENPNLPWEHKNWKRKWKTKYDVSPFSHPEWLVQKKKLDNFPVQNNELGWRKVWRKVSYRINYYRS